MIKSKRIITFVLTGMMISSILITPADIAKAEEVTGEYVVLVENKNGKKLIEKNYDVVEETQGDELENNNVMVVEMNSKEAQNLEKNRDVALVEENIVFNASGYNVVNEKNKKKKEKKTRIEKRKKTHSKKTESVTIDYRSEQWNMKAIRLPGTCDGKDTVRIGLIDSGITYNEDLIVQERFTINDKNEVANALFDDSTGHGTAIAGIIGAENNTNGIRGIFPDAEIYSIQVLDENNQTTLGQVIAGIYKAIEINCDIINMSFGTTVDSELLHQAIQDAHKEGILLVAAAGNRQAGNVEYPAAYPEVMAVGASNATGNKMEDTSDGTDIEVFAPGDQILTNGLFGGMVVTSGTSIAATHVTGAAALIWAQDKNKSEGFIRSLIVNTSQCMNDNGISDAGLLDIEQAFNYYNELASIYEDDEFEYMSIKENGNKAESYIGVKLVNGLWNASKHADMCSVAAKGYKISNDNLRLMQAVARKADGKDDCFNYSNVGCLHAGENYVQTTKFLYQCASYLRKGYSNDKAISEAVKDSGIKKQNVIDATKKILKSDILSGVEETSSIAKYYKVMGLAMHVVGDTFAHRTIVPKYTVKNPGSSMKKSTNASKHDARFGKGNFRTTSSHKMDSDEQLKKWASDAKGNRQSICKQWKCFQQAVNLGVVEFRDISSFAVGVSANDYEDNIDFCKERYVDAQMSCEVLMEEAYYKQKFDGVLTFLPTDSCVKLNNFKQYAERVGENTSYWTKSEWEKMSTLEYK